MAERYSDRALGSASTTRRRPPGATPRPRCSSPTTSASACTRRPTASPTHAAWDFAGTPAEHYPLLLHYPYFDLYRKQVVKQADLVLAMHLRGRVHAEQKARNFAYYEALTVRDSSLSACTQAVIAAEVGQLELAGDYLAEAALMDLDDLEHNTRTGCTSPPSAEPGPRWSPGWRGCARRRAHWASRHGCPRRSPGWR